MTVQLLPGDMRDVLKNFPSSHFDACVTDPPYELEFMGHDWDGTGISFEKATWRAVYRVLKPGAHLLAFGGTRTFHRIGVAIEDAGFEMRDAVAWLHGNGFPKNLNIARALRDEKPPRKHINPDDWQGWGTALKPAMEPVIVARKPTIGTTLDTVERFGTGAINIDGSRIPTTEDTARKRALVGDTAAPFGRGYEMGGDGSELGRYPANVVLDEAAAAALDAQAGKRGGGVGLAWGGSRSHVLHEGGKRSLDRTAGRVMGYDDEGGPSRFFYCAKPTFDERHAGLDDDELPHPTTKPIALMQWLIGLVTPPQGIVLDPFCGSGTTGIAAGSGGFDFVGIDMEYVAMAQKRLDYWRERDARS